MTRRTFATALCAPAWLPARESPYDAGSRAQLFVDDLLVRDTRGIAFTLHPARKHSANPLVTADRGFEGWRLELYGNVIWDAQEKIFKMWYLAEGGGHFRFEYNTHYAISTDGIRWEKPLVGTVPSKNGEKTNAVIEAQHLASVMKDMSDPDPARRYKLIGWTDEPRDKAGYHTMISPDGLNWKQFSTERICPSSDVITGYYDEQRKLYVAMPKIGTAVRGQRRRVFYLITSEDFVNWSKPELVFAPDLRDDAGSLGRIARARRLLEVPDDLDLIRTEFYGLGFYPAESVTLGFPWVFTINNNARLNPRNHEGPFELQLAATRDLRNWSRAFRVPCLEPGGPGEWDEGLVVTQSRAIRVGDEIRLYYGGANYTHGCGCLYKAEDTGRKTKFTGSIGLASWKLDRFVSADGHSADSALTTVPLVFSGERLEINASTGNGGSLRVELLDPAGRLLAGPSDPFRGDEVRAAITWRKNPSVASWKGKPVSVRFLLQNARLFSFAFRQPV
ncbi:MAG: hypothetical protein FJW39_22415 [Acidobacteria bacterium]|nr:hypothetical protein [Acidobacteriota bacterium]